MPCLIQVFFKRLLFFFVLGIGGSFIDRRLICFEDLKINFNGTLQEHFNFCKIISNSNVIPISNLTLMIFNLFISQFFVVDVEEDRNFLVTLSFLKLYDSLNPSKAISFASHVGNEDNM